MENRRFVRHFLIIYVVAVATSWLGLSFLNSVFAYSDETTHPALTDEIVDFFNFHHPELTLSVYEKELLIKGSVEEDAAGRWLRHFYDPVHERGLSLVGTHWQSSKDWAWDTVAQATYKPLDIFRGPMYGALVDYFSGETDYSWERAIYEYAWGDKEYALVAVGHTLHLIEDATVPDHTRNDSHPALGKRLLTLYPNASEKTTSLLEHFDTTNESPYETWTHKFDRNTITTFGDLLREKEKPLYADTLDEHFYQIASYSNNNFFSRDTIFADIYSLPMIDKFVGDFGFSQDDEILARKIELREWEGGEVEYTLIDKNKKILFSYWTRLSERGVRQGAGVIKLFFDEVEREKETKTLYNKNRNWAAKIFDATKKTIFNITNSLYGISAPYEELNEPTSPKTDSQLQGASIIQTLPDASRDDVTQSTETQEEPQTQEQEELPRDVALPDSDFPTSLIDDVSEPETSVENTEQQSFAQNQTETRDQFGLFRVPRPGGGGGGNASASEEEQLSNPPEEQQNEEPQNPPPLPPTITSPSDFSEPFTTDTILFAGTADPNSIIHADTNATTTVDDAGHWQQKITFPQGTSTVQFFAVDAENNQSSSTAATLFVDSEAPDLAFHITECDESLSKDGCLITTDTITLEWSSPVPDIAEYELSCISQSNACDTFPKILDKNATNTTLTLKNKNTTYALTLKASDTAGNESEKTETVEFFTAPVVINEIAWMGTDGHGEDEWIELYNPTSQPIDFDGNAWVLQSETDGTPTIPLSGSIPANGYYLIERKNSDEVDEQTESPVADVPADLWTSFSFGLKNSGEKLVLTHASSTIDEVAFCINWCAGSRVQKRTMERFNPLQSGLDILNWGTNNAVFVNGTNTEGLIIKGTPKARNSINYQITNSSQVTGNLTLTKSHGPYFVPARTETIAEGAVLTIEPGVVIKFFNTKSGMAVKGTLKAEGAREEPIVFTSFLDDAYGGDFNRDGTSTSPLPGSWRTLRIAPDSSDSVLDYVTIRYGGKFFTPAPPNERAAVRIDSADITIQNSIVEHSYEHGVALIDSGSVLENNTIRFNNNVAAANGILVEGGAPLIQNNTFRKNTFGVFINDAPDATIRSNAFIENGTAIFNGGLISAISDNSGSSNDIGGILIGGTLSSTGTTTLLKNDIPYILNDSLTVGADSVVTFDTGTVVKGRMTSTPSTLRVTDGGKVFFGGDSPDDLIFTSFYDDTAAGDSDNATSTVSQAGDWIGIRVFSGGMLDMSGFTLRYAGGRRTSGGDDKAGIKIEGTSATSTIQNALIEKNFQTGVYLIDGAAASIHNTTIQDHTEKKLGKATGLRLFGSSVALATTTFKNNELDIHARDAYSFTCSACTASTTEPDPL